MTEVVRYPVKILTALHAIMGACGYVQKKGKNQFHNYKYAGEGNLLEVLRPAMVEHGLLLIPSHKSVSEIDVNGITVACVEYTLAHKDGDVWPEKIVAYGAGGDKNSKGGVGDKGLYKALTGANKYLLFKLFQIETGDDPERDADDAPESLPDPSKVKNPPGRAKAVTTVREMCKDVNACEDGTQLIALINSVEFKKASFKTCCEFPNDWLGPEDNSGLSGVIAQMGVTLKCADDCNSWISKMESAARAANKGMAS